MELRQYWQIIRRRLWIVIAMLLIVLVVSLLLRHPRAPSYQATMRFMIGLEPETKNGEYYAYDKYYTWLTAEHLIDDVSELVRSGAFAQAVSEQLASIGLKVPTGVIRSSTQTGQLHRILAVSIVWEDVAQLKEIANAVVAVLPTEIARHLAQVGTGGVHASLIDPPAIKLMGASLREKFDLPIRLFLALITGTALAFLLDYLDDTVQTKQELEQSGFNVLAEIPPFHKPCFRQQRLP